MTKTFNSKVNQTESQIDEMKQHELQLSQSKYVSKSYSTSYCRGWGCRLLQRSLL